MYPKLRTLLLRLSALAVAAVLACAPAADAAARGPLWEVVHVTEPDSMGREPGQAAFDVEIRNGYIYITTASDVTVEVFTILGQPVTRRLVHPGTVRLSLGARGIYILKGAGTTRRVNL